MSITYKDRVREGCTFNSVNDVTLNGASSVQYTEFNNGITDYLITNVDQSLWEVGRGTVLAGTLTRDIVQANSSGNLSKIDFGFTDGIAMQAVTAEAINKLTKKMVWEGAWDNTVDTYEESSVVKDDKWTMICVNPNGCTERPAPQPIGLPAFIYTGTLVGTTDTQKQIIFGSRYTWGSSGFLNKYRIYTYTGFEYDVFSVLDPLGTPIVNSVISFTATTTGWQEFNIDQRIVAAGAKFDIAVIVHEPPVAPTSWNGNWNYTKPNNVVAPAAGEIVHSNKLLDTLRISKTDNDGNDETDRTPGSQLADVAVGDEITGGGMSWTVQSTSDDGTYFSFEIMPIIQGAVTGVQSIIFDVVPAAIIDYGAETNGSLPYTDVQGFYSSDGVYANIVVDDNQYGVDINVQVANISSEWETVAYSN